MSSAEPWTNNFTEFLKGRGKIQQLAELTAVEHMQATAEEQRKNQEAESAWVRKNLWGSDETGKDDDEMRQTVLGDVNHPAPIIMQQPAPAAASPWPLALALAAAGGIAGYMLNDKTPATAPEAAAVEFDDQSVSIGLGRIQDYIKSEPTP
jgi:hypothetical protein